VAQTRWKRPCLNLKRFVEAFFSTGIEVDQTKQILFSPRYEIVIALFDVVDDLSSTEEGEMLLDAVYNLFLNKNQLTDLIRELIRVEVSRTG
jgi:hypothetical protein